MLTIISNKLAHEPKGKRRVVYQPSTPPDFKDQSMGDLLRDKNEKDQAKQRKLEQEFRDRIKSSSCWRHRYKRSE